MLTSSSGVVHAGYDPQNERKLSETFVCVNSLMSNKGRDWRSTILPSP